MDKFNNDNIIDTNFEEVKEDLLKDKDIKKEPLYYTRVQVAKILDEKDSVISYWSKEFQPILKLKIINMARKYTKKDVENLLFIQKLIRQDGLSIKQTLDYCCEKGFSLENKTIEDNPLAIKTFIAAMTDEFDKKILEMQNKIIFQQLEMTKNLQNIIIESNKELKIELSITVDDVVSEKLSEINDLVNQQNKDTLTRIDELEKKATERDIKLIDKLKENLEKHRQEYEENIKIKHEKKSFFNKLFKYLQQ